MKAAVRSQDSYGDGLRWLLESRVPSYVSKGGSIYANSELKPRQRQRIDSNNL